MKNRIKKLAKVSIFQILKPNHSMIHQTFQRSSLPPQRKKKENHLCPLFKRLPPLPILPSKEKSERKARSSIDSRQVAAASSLQWNVCFQRRESFEPGGKTPRRGWTERFPLFLPPLASYSFTYGARLYQGPITIDNRPIGAKPRVYIYIYVYIEPHRFVGSMTNNSHNGPSRFQPLAPLPPRFHSSLQPFLVVSPPSPDHPPSPRSCYTRPDRFRQFYIHVRPPLIYYNVCHRAPLPSSLLSVARAFWPPSNLQHRANPPPPLPRLEMIVSRGDDYIELVFDRAWWLKKGCVIIRDGIIFFPSFQSSFLRIKKLRNREI